MASTMLNTGIRYSSKQVLRMGGLYYQVPVTRALGRHTEEFPVCSPCPLPLCWRSTNQCSRILKSSCNVRRRSISGYVFFPASNKVHVGRTHGEVAVKGAAYPKLRNFRSITCGKVVSGVLRCSFPRNFRSITRGKVGQNGTSSNGSFFLITPLFSTV